MNPLTTGLSAPAQARVSSLPPAIEKFAEVPWHVYAILAVLVLACAVLALGAKRNRWDSHSIAMGGMCIAMSFVLNCIQLFRMPQGGSVTPAAMLPIVLYMVACGPLKGFVVGCAFGMLQLISDPYVIHPIQLLMDYPLAYGSMILCCLASRIPSKAAWPLWRLPLAALLAGVGQYCMAVLSGAVFFSGYAGAQNAWIYSMVYNLSYIGMNTLVCMAAACIPGMARLIRMVQE